MSASRKMIHFCAFQCLVRIEPGTSRVREGALATCTNARPFDTHSTPQHTTIGHPYDTPAQPLQPDTPARPTVLPAARGWTGEPARASRRGSPLQVSRISPRILIAAPTVAVLTVVVHGHV